MAKAYLGDGVYCDFDGAQIILTTENGIQTTNRIVFEPEVYTAFVHYAKNMTSIGKPVSEYEKIWQDRDKAKADHYGKTGRPPVICLMGYTTYWAFRGAITIRFHLGPKDGLQSFKEYRGPIKFEGMNIYPCWHVDSGYFFGSPEPEGLI